MLWRSIKKNIGASKCGGSPLLAGFFTYLFLSVNAFATDWQPTLLIPPGSDGDEIGRVINIKLPELPDSILANLAVEIDAVDVTQQATLSSDGRLISLEVGIPFSTGEHHLTLLEISETGNLIRRGEWELNTSSVRARWVQEYDYNGNMSGSTRVLERKKSESETVTSIIGSGRVGYTASNNILTNTAEADLLYDGNADETGARRKADIGDFLLATSWDNGIVQAGHHFPGPIVGSSSSSLIMDQTSRRGISAAFGGGMVIPSNLALFVLRTDHINGFVEGMGIGDNENRMQGFLADSKIYERGNNSFKVGIGWVTGQGQEGGTAISDPSSANTFYEDRVKGQAQSVLFETSLLDGQIASRGEFARATQDIGFGLDDIEDDAYSILVAYQPATGISVNDKELSWGATLDHQKIGGLFRSIAYQGGAADMEVTRLSSQANYGSFNLQWQISKSEDNVNAFDIPTNEAITEILSLQYLPLQPANGWPAWFNQPSFDFSLSRDQRETVQSNPSRSAALEIDAVSTSASFGISAGQPFGTWGVRYSPAKYQDNTGNYSDTKSQTYSFDASFLLSERYSVTPQLTLDNFQDENSGTTTDTQSLGLSQSIVLIKDVLQAGLSLNRNRTELSDGSQDMLSKTANLNLDWRVPFYQDMSVWLRANYIDIEERGGLVEAFRVDQFYSVADNKDYQVFVGLNLQFSSN